MLLNLNALAANRGEGLHPRLAAVLKERAILEADPSVHYLVSCHGDGSVQAGPNPVPAGGVDLPHNAVRFPFRRDDPARRAPAPVMETACTSR